MHLLNEEGHHVTEITSMLQEHWDLLWEHFFRGTLEKFKEMLSVTDIILKNMPKDK